MKRLITMLALCLSASAVFAQDKPAAAEPKGAEYNTTREFKQKVFELKHRSPNTLFPSVAPLGSGFKGSVIGRNSDLGTITVRDFPENIAAIEDAIKRLDRPAAAAPAVELKVSVLLAGDTAIANSSLPDDLKPVVKQLQSTLRYTTYSLLSATIHRTTTGISGRGLEGSGVVDSALINPERAKLPVTYEYRLSDLKVIDTPERSAFDIGSFDFKMSVPLATESGVHFQSVGFQTPVSIRNNEKVVIGTSTMGDKALIVVVTASIAK